MMFNSALINRIGSILCAGLALLIMVIPLTEMHNIQVTALLGLYFALDPSYLLLRALFFLLASLSVSIIAFRSPEAMMGENLLQQAVITIVIGLLTSLIIFYGWTCCDNPVFFLLGFPFSWLRGVAPVMHYLPEPPLQYLLANILSIHWYIDSYSLAFDVLFWSNICLLICAVDKLRMQILPPGRIKPSKSAS